MAQANVMASRKRLAPEQCAFALFLHQEKRYSLRQVAVRTKMSKSSVWRIVRNKRGKSKSKSCGKRGRRKVLTLRDRRKLNRAVHALRQEDPNFTVMDVVKRSGIAQSKANYRTFLREIRSFGYAFRPSRRKGILTEEDLKLRRDFAKSRLKECPPDYWSRHVAFYLDGVSFIYKGNPMSDAKKPKGRVWRKKGEGLTVTTKGSKDLAGGKRLHLIVVIAYGKGVILAEPYEKMSADFFSCFVRRNFPTLFEIAGKGEHDRKIFVMDNDPSQTSAKAMRTVADMGYTMQKIPARSPDLNPIENVFHLVRKRIEAQVKENNIVHQTWDQFKQIVQYNIWSTSKDLIDKTIRSMNNRLHEIVKTNGKRTKY